MPTVEYIASIVSLLLFYVIIIGVGIGSTVWFRRRHKLDGNDFDFQIIAGRKLGSFVGWLTMSGNNHTYSTKTHLE